MQEKVANSTILLSSCFRASLASFFISFKLNLFVMLIGGKSAVTKIELFSTFLKFFLLSCGFGDPGCFLQSLLCTLGGDLEKSCNEDSSKTLGEDCLISDP